VAVQAFLDLRIGFAQIARVIAHVLDTVPSGPAASIAAVMAQDALARECAEAFIAAGLAAAPAISVIPARAA